MAKRRSTRSLTIYRSARRRIGHSFGSKKISVALVGGLATGLINAYSPPDHSAGAPENLNQYFQRVLLYYTGFAPWNPAGAKFQFQYTRFGLAPLAAGALIHWVANATGVNRGLAKFTRSIPVQI